MTPAHKATYEGKVAAEVIVATRGLLDALGDPGLVDTDPQIAWCGTT